MKIKILKSFSDKFSRQLAYIAIDKPEAAKKFRLNVLEKIRMLSQFPYKNK